MRKHAILTSIIITLLGVVLFMWPGGTLTAICKIIGVSLLIVAFISARAYMNGRETGGLIAGFWIPLAVAAGIGGIVLLVKPELIVSILPMACGVAIMINGIVNLSQAVSLKKNGFRRWSIHMIFGIVTIILGVVLFTNPFETMTLWVKILGVILIYDGVSNIVTDIRLK